MIGQTLGHYRIVEKIGAGGMGEVYRAHDTRLERDVAVKILPVGTLADEAARKRFRKEALILSKLNHPHVATVFDFDTQNGIDFLVMEHITGTTLAQKAAGGPLPEPEVTKLGCQVANALEEAHEQGLVHRDLKPSNIMVTPKGQVKVLDFGLARLLLPFSEMAATESLAEVHPVAGTLPYMAPEQLRGESVDHRSDIWAVGAVLYELAAGQRPFDHKVATALAADIQTKAPPIPTHLNPKISPQLENIVMKCLEKDPENRYQSAKELGVDLRRLGSPITQTATTSRAPARGPARRSWIAIVALAVILLAAAAAYWNIGGFRDLLRGTSARPRIGSLAVLPLENVSRDPDQEYFADGMTEALITDLAQISALRVISQTSTMQYKGVRRPLPDIARELNVDAILEGSVLRVGGRVRITAQLVRANPEQNLWAKSYERDLGDVLALQSEVARAVADEVRIQLTAQETTRLAAAPRINPEAHDAYLRGRYYWNKGEREDLEKAREYFEQALEKDPRYAPALAGLADYYSVLPFYSNALPNDVFPKAKHAVARALELDDSLAEAHGTLAYIRTYYDWDWVGAEREFQRALTLNPNDATLRHRYSRYLSSLGRTDEALAEMTQARALDPLSQLIKANVGVIYYFSRQYDRAIEELQKVLQDDPNFSVAHWGLGLAYEQKGDFDRALPELEKAAARRGTNSLASLGHAYGVTGNKKKAREILAELKARARKEAVSGYQLALVHLGLGETELAHAALQEAFRERSTLLTYLKMDPRFDPLRSDPRFQSLLRRMNLPE